MPYRNLRALRVGTFATPEQQNALSEGKTVTTPGGYNLSIQETQAYLVRVPKGWRTNDYSFNRIGDQVRLTGEDLILCDEYQINTQVWKDLGPSAHVATKKEVLVSVPHLEKATWGAFLSRKAPGGGWTIHPADDLRRVIVFGGKFPEIVVGAGRSRQVPIDPHRGR